MKKEGGEVVFRSRVWRTEIQFAQHLAPRPDGRLKPNVCAMGTRVDVANPSRNHLYTKASGTSFASPLTAGFAACAWQTHREWNCQQLLAEIEKSGSLHPYYDYQYGYGVFFDTGIYGRWNFGCRQTIGDKGIRVRERDDQHVVNRLEWGVRARLGYDIVSVYVQYRISRLLQKRDFAGECPHLEVGAHITLPFGK
ncbi:MAG: S8 family serine peptidase [Bacteroidales bacterium]|nr:S8 family serine peptidase [Bacteroidales bacterium]